MQQQLLSVPSQGCCVLLALQLQAWAFSSLDHNSSSCGFFPPVSISVLFCFVFSYFWIFLASLACGKPSSSEGFPMAERAMQKCAEHIFEQDRSVAGERTPPAPLG